MSNESNARRPDRKADFTIPKMGQHCHAEFWWEEGVVYLEYSDGDYLCKSHNLRYYGGEDLSLTEFVDLIITSKRDHPWKRLLVDHFIERDLLND